MDAIKLLKAGHYQIRDLLEDLCDADADARQVRSDLLAQVAGALEIHSRIGNEIFYPAFADVAERDRDVALLDETIEETRILAEVLLPDLLETDVASEQFGGRAKVLRELVEHHIREIEAELFPRSKKLMSHSERNVLGERILQRKQELREGVPSWALARFHPTQGDAVMPPGDKSSYTGKQKRKAEHIEEGYEDRGVSKKEAERRAWATVNKQSGGGKKSGSGKKGPSGAKKSSKSKSSSSSGKSASSKNSSPKKSSSKKSTAKKSSSARSKSGGSRKSTKSSSSRKSGPSKSSSGK